MGTCHKCGTTHFIGVRRQTLHSRFCSLSSHQLFKSETQEEGWAQAQEKVSLRLWIMYSPNPTQLFWPPHHHLFLFCHCNPSTLFKVYIPEEEKNKKLSSKMLPWRGRGGGIQKHTAFIFLSKARKNSCKEEKEIESLSHKEQENKRWERLRETNFKLWSFNIF